jgi:hypothetical protein
VLATIKDLSLEIVFRQGDRGARGGADEGRQAKDRKLARHGCRFLPRQFRKDSERAEATLFRAVGCANRSLSELHNLRPFGFGFASFPARSPCAARPDVGHSATHRRKKCARCNNKYAQRALWHSGHSESICTLKRIRFTCLMARDAPRPSALTLLEEYPCQLQPFVRFVYYSSNCNPFHELKFYREF